MSLSDLSIERPVLTWMMTLALAVFGVLGFLRLGIDQYPDMTFPFVGVVVTLEGASPTTMEDEVVDVLEEAFATIEGIRHTFSTSAQGMARVMLEFELEHDLDVAAQDVRDKINISLNDLPRDIDPPILGKADFSMFPIIYAPITSSLPTTETTEYVDRHIRPIVESIPGAAGAEIYGDLERNIRIWVQPDALRARNLSVGDVLDALRREHVERPGGFVEGATVEWAVKTDAEFRSIEELGAMVISSAPSSIRATSRSRIGASSSQEITIAPSSSIERNSASVFTAHSTVAPSTKPPGRSTCSRRRASSTSPTERLRARKASGWTQIRIFRSRSP